MKVVLPSLDSFCRYKRFLFSLAALVDPVQNILFLAGHYFTSFVLTVQQAGHESCRVACLFYVRLWWWHWLSVLYLSLFYVYRQIRTARSEQSPFIMRKGWEATFLLYIIPGKKQGHHSYWFSLCTLSWMIGIPAGAQYQYREGIHESTISLRFLHGQYREVFQPLRVLPWFWPFCKKLFTNKLEFSSLIACFVKQSYFKGKQRETKPSPHPISAVAV